MKPFDNARLKMSSRKTNEKKEPAMKNADNGSEKKIRSKTTANIYVVMDN